MRKSVERINKTAEKGCLEFVLCIEKLKFYLCQELVLRTELSALQWLLTRKEPSGRLEDKS